MTIILLPFPPSVNGLYAGKARRFKSGRYKDWLAEAWHAYLQQRPRHYSGEVRVVMRAGRPDKRRRDISNLIKAPEDFLVKAGVLDDDSQIIDIRALWDKEINGIQVEINGIQVEIEDL